MAYFRYKVTAGGKVTEGVITSQTQTAAVRELRERGYLVVSIKEVKKKSKDVSWGKIKFTDKMLFTEHLAIMLQAEIPLDEALSILAEQAAGKFKEVITSLYEKVETGQTLADCLSDHPKVFPAIYISLVRAGESSGTLVENLNHLAVQQRKSYDLKNKVRSAMIYPIIVLSATFFIGLGLSIFILPKITEMFSKMDMELPVTTRALIWVSGILQKYNIWVLVFFVALFAFMTWFFKQSWVKPYSHAFILHVPIVKKLSQSSNLASFCLSLGTMLESGLTIDEGLKITSRVVANVKYRDFLQEVVFHVSRGNTISSKLEKDPNLFSAMTTRMIKIGEKSGKLTETLKYLATFYEKQVNTLVDTLSAVLEPVLLVFIGLAVGVVALAILTPILKITGAGGG